MLNNRGNFKDTNALSVWQAEEARTRADYYSKNFEKWKGQHRRQRYGISQGAYEFLTSLQGYRCGICKRELELCIDHNRKTKEFRGLLCRHCNTFLETYETLYKGVGKYLGRF